MASILTVGLDDVVARTNTGSAEYFLKDALGSTIALSGAGGEITTSYTYEPFGGTSVSGAASENSSEFAGRENDGSALYFFRARYYSTKLQRFVSEDPISPLGGPNAYVYAYNDPLNWIDPFPACVFAAIPERHGSHDFATLSPGAHGSMGLDRDRAAVVGIRFRPRKVGDLVADVGVAEARRSRKSRRLPCLRSL